MRQIEIKDAILSIVPFRIEYDRYNICFEHPCQMLITQCTQCHTVLVLLLLLLLHWGCRSSHSFSLLTVIFSQTLDVRSFDDLLRNDAATKSIAAQFSSVVNTHIFMRHDTLLSIPPNSFGL